MKKNKFMRVKFKKNLGVQKKLSQIQQQINTIINPNNDFFHELFAHPNSFNLIKNYSTLLIASHEGFMISSKTHPYVNCPQNNQGFYYHFKVFEQGLLPVIKKCSCFITKFGAKKRIGEMHHFFGHKWNHLQLQDITLDQGIRSKIMTYFTKYINNYPKPVKTLYLIGNKGVGKSYILASFANSLLKKEEDIVMIDTLDFFTNFLVSKSEEFIKSQKQILKTCKVLFLENIGNEPINTFTRDYILGDIINYRFTHKKPIFFSSKYNFLQLKKRYSKNNAVVNAKQIIDQIRSFSIPIIIEKNL